MNKFGLLLYFVAIGILDVDEQLKQELQELAGGQPPSAWFLKAAGYGYRQGVNFACAVVNDPASDLESRQQVEEACDQAGKK